ncbi:MAG: hypothetical protein QNK38_07845 [Nitrospirota bacterium]|nr:hypothetical protein [Nitrospirota bacterium]MDX2421027.1 hypothetical protein [Nitrospirota bacterium]
MKTPSTCLGLFWCLAGTLVLSGCQGSGQTVNFEPRALASQPTRVAAVHENDLTIVVEPFEDARPQQHRLGSRTHMWGGVTHFTAWNGQISEGMADLAIEYLQERQWRASKSTAETNSDVIVKGTILSLNANAKSRPGATDITVDMKVRFEAKNKVDGSTVRMVLGANGSDSVAFFAPKDVERLINLVAKDLYQQLFQDLIVKNKAFQIRQGNNS